MNCRNRPCAECPWAKTTEPGQFPRERYEALRSTSGGPDGHAAIDAPFFACHKSHEGREVPCAGWLASVGHDSLRVRIAVSAGDIPAEKLSPCPDWPELYETYNEMEEAMGR